MIIDAHPVVRLGIKRLLEPDWDTEELTDGRGAVELLNSVGKIDVAIVEMRPSKQGVPSGAATIRRLLHALSGISVVAHGGRVERHAIAEAKDAGAAGYVSKRSAPTTIRTAVETVHDLRPFMDPAADLERGVRPPITRRQREILQLFADGHSTDDAAKRLGLSTETVRTHAKASLPRLGARDRAHAVAIALRDSLID
jgi:DNA-binding NarL/FixJ family response regulator